MKYPKALEELILSFKKLPVIGPKTAERLALHILLGANEEDVKNLSSNLLKALEEVHPCKNCGISDIRVLCLDHIDGNGNIHRKNGGKKGINLYKNLYKHNFISDYNFQVLCANCNMIKFFENKESSSS